MVVSIFTLDLNSVNKGSHTPQGLPPNETIILNNRCGVATLTTTISSISVASEAVVKAEHVQS